MTVQAAELGQKLSHPIGNAAAGSGWMTVYRAGDSGLGRGCGCGRGGQGRRGAASLGRGVAGRAVEPAGPEPDRDDEYQQGDDDADYQAAVAGHRRGLIRNPKGVIGPGAVCQATAPSYSRGPGCVSFQAVWPVDGRSPQGRFRLAPE